jgi:X-Pro dipeptidyl-peptidase
MKYNQYAYQEVPLSQQKEELLAAGFLPKNYEELSFAQLAESFFETLLVPAHGHEAKHAQLAELAVDEKTTLAAFLESDPEQMTAGQFYNAALQILGYHVYYDYDPQDPIALMDKNALPHVASIKDKDELIHAVYRLLVTRAKNGQELVDVLAGQGYFTQFWGQGKFMFLNGKALPVFDTSKVIREVVYVASDLDTDQDGENDLLQVSIFRPAESGKDLKVPALYTASPYFGGIIENAKTNHSVDEDLTDATTWTNPQYEASPVIEAAKPGPEDVSATESAVGKSSYPVNEFLLARGFASVFAGAIGTRGSDGLRITGAPEETESAKEIIEWLHGDRIAYTDRTRKHETKASWCNGNIGMTGRSYLGTLQIAIATTGVKGLKTVVSEAAISSWYDYYREHGLVIAPGECQGEDLDKLAETCQSNLWDAGDAIKIRPKYEAMQKKLLEKEDRTTGQYSDFWEARNYRHHTDGIKCSWLSVHGLNDWNVKPKNVYKVWQKVKNLPVDHHLFLHQGPHYNINNLASIDFTDLLNMWFCHELLGVENDIRKIMPTVLIQDNLEADTWHEEEDWADSLGDKVVLHASEDGKLGKAEGKGVLSFHDEGGKAFKEAKLSDGAWEYKFICGDEPWSDPSLRFVSEEITKPITLVGRPEIKIKTAASRKVGQLSVALVELGERQRLTPTPKFLMRNGQELGYRFGTDTLQEFVPDKPTKAKLITKAHMNLQNWQDMKKPAEIEEGKFYELNFKLQPTYYTLPAGSRLALIVYSTDQGMTKRPLTPEDYEIDLGGTSLTLFEK